MLIQQMRYLRGPNIYAASPVLEAVLDVAEETRDREVLARSRRVFTAIAENPEYRSPHAPRENLLDAFAQMVIHLQHRAGLRASFRSVGPSSQTNHFMIAVECPEETVGRGAAEIATRLFNDALHGDVVLSPEEERRLRDLEYATRYPISTAVIVHAARRRGIPVRRLSPEYGRILFLGQGSKQHRCQASEPDNISALAQHISTDKHFAKELMAKAGVPVPVGKLVKTVEQAWSAAQELGVPVAIKPLDCDLQIGVSLDLRNREQVEAAFRTAKEHSSWVLVERFAPGLEHRVLVVDGKIVAVTRIDPPQVMGDGEHTVAELVAEINRDPLRGEDGSDLPRCKLKLDDVALEVLAVQGFDLKSVPPKGQCVLVRRNPPYFKNGGNLIDLTDQIHPSVAGHAAAAAEALQLRVAGLDVVAVDICQPLEAQSGAVIEINAGPGLWLHLAPWADSPRPVGDAIVASMFPPGDDGHIPVVALVGNGAAEFSARRWLQALLGLDGWRVGQVGLSEICIAGRRWPAPGEPHERAQQLFQYPGIDMAILETTPEELLRFGFGNDRCDVVVSLAESSPSPLEVDVPLEPGTFMKALRHALIPGGSFITLAHDEAAAMKAGVSSDELFLVAMPSSQHIGHLAIAVDSDGLIFVATQTGDRRQLGRCPASLSETDRQCLLAALAAGLALGVREASLKSYLASL